MAYRFCALLLVLGTGVSGMGCSSLGIAKSQHLPETLPQAWPLAAPADHVWQLVTEEAQRHAGCRLAEAPTERVLSWCEAVENWRDLGQDTVGSEADPAAADAYEKLVQAPSKGTAVTTVWVEEHGATSWLHIRRVYYGAESWAGVGHSRGDYERELYKRLLSRVSGSPRNS